MLVAERKGGNEGAAEPGGEEALGGPVIIRFGYPARDESSLPKAALVAARQQPASQLISIHGSAAASQSMMTHLAAKWWRRGTTIRNGSLSSG